MEYNLKLSNRKTIALHILKDGTLEVRAPKNVHKSVITDFVLSKQDWVSKNIDRAKERKLKKSEFTLEIGDFLLYKGTEYKILENDKNAVSFDHKNFYMPKGIPFEILKPAFVKLYRNLAKEEILEKITYYSEIMDLKCTNVKINSAKTRWGSCSGKNSLNFSWKLILADENTINYVVVHELAHTKEHNHSDSFWKIVKKFVPNYDRERDKLKELQKKLSLENWD